MGQTYGEKEGSGMSVNVLRKRAEKDGNVSLKKVRGILGTNVRPFARVIAKLKGEKEKEYWAQLITGSLYSIDTGKCITSDMLKIVK